MSRFYGSIQGSRGEATRLGHSGIHGHIRGWNHGAKVIGRIDDDGKEVFDLYATAGSHGRTSDKRIGRVVLDDNGDVKFEED